MPVAEDNNTNSASATSTISIYYYHPDHLGTNTLLTDMSGNAYQLFLNLPFGESMAEQSSTGYYQSPYKFNGKELDKETGLYYYGARYYDAKGSLWLGVDPLAEKYPSYSPYNYCLNNPIIYFDADGRDVFLYHISQRDKFGNIIPQKGLSALTESMLKDIMKTKEGLNFIAQFAAKDQIVAGHKFDADGINKDFDLVITDFSFENEDNPLTNVAGEFGPTYNKERNNLTFNLPLVSALAGNDKFALGETYTHESRLHDDVTYYINAFKKGGVQGFNNAVKAMQKLNPRGYQDHQDLKFQNLKSAAYKRYAQQREELIKLNPNYKKAFNNAAKVATINY